MPARLLPAAIDEEVDIEVAFVRGVDQISCTVGPRRIDIQLFDVRTKTTPSS
ncbi:MAG TPA: hypothetical protein VLV78_07005 [Thermoanaerobaculia bacterium]|nr:hypothetical protein [Thermoanaerobaculia bacterium]